MLRINASLPSGRNENLFIPQSSKVGDLRILAQKSFGQGFLRLVTADGLVLDPLESVQQAGIEGGDHLTALALQVNMATTANAFALWLSGGNRVLTWGDPKEGGDCSQVQELRNVKHVQGTDGAFAAILEGGSVVTWGSPGAGGDSSLVQDQLRTVKQIQSTSFAFAAILEDGSLVSWGDQECGGDSSAVQDRLQRVRQVQATGYAFAAMVG